MPDMQSARLGLADAELSKADGLFAGQNTQTDTETQFAPSADERVVQAIRVELSERGRKRGGCVPVAACHLAEVESASSPICKLARKLLHLGVDARMRQGSPQVCHVCGGRTEKDPVLAEGEQDIGPSDDGKGREHRIIRVCDQCLKGADGLSIDQRLESFARFLDAEAKFTRAMIGRLQVPSYAEWEAAQGESIAF